MEQFIVSARKYRPTTFDSVVGQKALTTTLKNAVKSGKLANAYLFCGPRGVGKTTCARIFAKAINCQNPTPDGEACNECESCKAFNEGRSFNIFELDAASNNSTDDIRKLIEQTQVPPQTGRYKVFIIDEVHMLSQAAFNAFLKTLEEPPSYVVFILATTEKQKILPTILSRCQIYDFDRMSVADIQNHLKKVAQKEGIAIDEQSLAVIAEKADGGMRDALSIFDQTASFCQGNITYEKVLQDLNVLDADNYFRLVDMALQNKVSDMMVLLNNLINKGFDGGRIVNGLASHLRNVLMAKNEETLPLLQTSESYKQRFQEQAKKCPTSFIYKALEIATRCDINYRASSNKRLLTELTLIEIAQITQKDDADGSAAGRSPKRLKSLFHLHASRPKSVQQVTGASKQGAAASAPTPQASRRTVALNPSPVAAEPAAAASAATPSPTATPHIKLSNLGVTFAGLKKMGEKKATGNEPQIKNPGEHSEFTQEQLSVHWLMMCNRMPQEMRSMAMRMKNMEPHITTFPNIELVVDNDILLHQIEAIKGRIRTTMANELHNADIQFSLRLAEKEELTPILSKRELFDQMRRNNPAIEKLRVALGLELD